MNSVKILSISRLISSKNIHTSSQVCKAKRWTEKSEPPFQSELKNPVAEVFGGAEAWPSNEVRK